VGSQQPRDAVPTLAQVCLPLEKEAILSHTAPCCAALILASLLGSAALAEDAAWRPLFDGQSLAGWIQRGGVAKYRVENGEIVGTSVPKTGNWF